MAVDPSLMKLEPEEVNDLTGLTLRMAIALYLFDWKWYDRECDGYPRVLLDEPVPEGKNLNSGITHYVGSGYHVLACLPKYDEDLVLAFDMQKKLSNRRGYMYRLELELRSADHFQLCCCGAEARFRAMLKLAIEKKRREDKAEAEKKKLQQIEDKIKAIEEKTQIG